MKTRNSKTKAHAFLGAALMLLIAMLFTGCPQTTGGGSGSGGPTVKLTVTGDANINLPADPAVAVRVGSSWQQVRAEVSR